MEDTGIMADRNNNNHRNKIFTIDLVDGNCSNSPNLPVPQHVNGQQPQQQHHQQQHAQQDEPPVLAPQNACTIINLAGSPAVLEPQNVSYNAGTNQYGPQYSPSQVQGYPPYPPPQPQGYPPYPPPQPQGYPPYPPPQAQGYPQYGAAPQPGYPVQGGLPQQGYPQYTVQYVAIPTNQSQSSHYPGYGPNAEVTVVRFKGLETPEERIKFIRGVYFILMLQLSFLFGVVCLCTFVEGVQKAVQQPAVIIIGFIMYIGCAFALCCCTQIMMSTNPYSVSVLIILTFGITLVVANVASTYSPETVLLAIGVTLVVTLAMTIIACTCAYDFTKLLGVMCVVLVVLILFGIVSSILWSYMPILHIIYAYLGAIVFSVYIIIDTQMLMNGKRYSLSTDMTIFGAINLFLDIVNLFLYMLAIVDSNN